MPVCLPRLLRFPWFPGSLRCVAQNPRILLMVNVIQRIHYSYACAFYFSLPFYFSHRDPRCCTLSFNCVQVQTLPKEQATPALTDSFSRGYDPYTHACKARPPTIVGRTSLSVIVSLSHVNNARLKGHSDNGKVAQSVPELAEHMGLRSDQIVFLIAFCCVFLDAPRQWW